MGIEYILTADGELYHHGTKGMKWGVRRYQNKDGSLTPAGKKRYAKEEADLKAREKTIKNRERESARRAKLDAKKADLDAREAALNGGGKKKTNASSVPQKKSIKDMSDAELNDAINRARMEDMYRNLRPEPVAKPSFGKQLVSDVVKPAMLSSGRKALENVIDKTVKDLLKDKVDPNSLDALKKTAEKLELQRKIAKLKKGEDPNEKPLSWEEKLKKQTWEQNEEKRAAKKAEEERAARAAEESARAKQENEDRQHAYYAHKAAVKDQAEQKSRDRAAKENQDAYYERKEQVRQESADRNAKRKQDEYYERKERAKRDAEPRVTVEDGPSRANGSSDNSSNRKGSTIVDADIASDKQLVRYSANTGLSTISKTHTSAGRDYVENFSWDDLNYSHTSGSSPRKSGNSEYDVESLLRRNGEKLDDWYERMKRDGFI